MVHRHAHHHHERRHTAEGTMEEIMTFFQSQARSEELAPVQLELNHSDLEIRAISAGTPGESSSEGGDTKVCDENNPESRCTKPQGSRALPIALSASLPIIVAIVVFIFLHRRSKKKVRMEDLDAKHKSLDFGYDPVAAKRARKAKGKKGGNEMMMSEKSGHGHANGLSLDMNLSSPYMLPPGMNGSRESFHSLSRSLKDSHDPYAPVSQLSKDGPYARGLRAGETGSSYSGSSRGTDRLLRGASPMGQSRPQRADSISPPTSDATPPEIKFPDAVHHSDSAISGLPPPMPKFDADPSAVQTPQGAQGDSYFGSPSKDLPIVAAQLGDTTVGRKPLPQDTTTQAPADSHPLRLQSMEASVHGANTQSMASISSDYGDHFKVTPPSPIVETTLEVPARHSLDAAPSSNDNEQAKAVGLGVDGTEAVSKRLSMSIRPLPHDDPTENPEERANRIRSFYREYFDDSKPDPVGHYGDYYEDYGQEYLDGAIFDPETGAFVMTGAPYAQPITRRAMTPPPRAPPRFGSKSNLSAGARGRFGPPRGQSAMSARGAPKKQLPPPQSLQSLPTPHLLKDDSNFLFTSMDFAPPVSFRDRQAGRRPDSPLGTPRPYSPMVQPYVPLESPFRELKAMPSPHLLRKSGTFTGLDFAPNAHLLKPESDGQSIKSSRSGMSRMHLQNIRAGAYRVSRIPKDAVGTVDDLAVSLKPKWDLTSPG